MERTITIVNAFTILGVQGDLVFRQYSSLVPNIILSEVMKVNEICFFFLCVFVCV